MSTRPEIELALDVRSYERVAIISGQDSEYDYPETWTRPLSISAEDIDDNTVVIIDRVEVQRKTLAQISDLKPRLVAFAVAGVEHEKQVRRTLATMFPWGELWTVFTSFGKLLVTKDMRGPAYERDELVDMRTEFTA